MVLSTGMPRAGSTWQHAMVMGALQQLRVPIAHKGYWDYAYHNKKFCSSDTTTRLCLQHLMSKKAQQAWYASEYKAWAQLKHDSVVAYKSHEYVPDATRFCNRTAVITIHRCLDHEARSVLGVGWLGKDPSAANVADKMSEYLRYHEAWKRYGALDLEYESMRAQPLVAMHLIVYYLARSE